MPGTPDDTRPWWRDRSAWILFLGAVIPRLLIVILWGTERCFRDECMYLFTADRMATGFGMTATNGWLWAPAYIALMAIHSLVFFGEPATVLVTQIPLAGFGAVLLRRLARRVVGEPAATWAAWIYALSPTLAFFGARHWSETIYGVLLLYALEGVVLARERVEGPHPLKPAVRAGITIGLCVLMRGVATYILPIFLGGLLWGRLTSRRAWSQALVLGAVAVATVGPYSAYATHKFGTFIVSDKTMGQMMWLGDNDFPPVTFDYGNGLLTDRDYERVTSTGRPHCAEKDEPIARDRCETQAGIAWIRANPDEFVRRIPLRLAQTLNPHSFLTRHLRNGYWEGLPDAVDEVLCVIVVLVSFATVLGAALGAWSRGPAVYPIMLALITGYHLAAIACLAGLTRYRVPLDTIWLPFAAAALSQPLPTLRLLRQHPWRLAGAVLTVGALLPLMLWFLPVGFPRWGTW